jgi:hypothetical protein
MVFARVPEELLGVEVSDRSQRQPCSKVWLLAVWTLIELCLTQAWVEIEARSEPVGVQVRRLYDGAGHRTTQASWCSSALATDTQRASAELSCLQAKQPADVDDREEIVRPIASLTLAPWHLGFPIHKGASFLFLHVKVWFAIAKTLLATNQEQP